MEESSITCTYSFITLISIHFFIQSNAAESSWLQAKYELWGKSIAENGLWRVTDIYGINVKYPFFIFMFNRVYF